MGFTSFLGKLLIVASLCFQAFLLYQDKSEGDQFNRNLKSALASCDCLASIKPHLEQYLRLVVAGLLFSSTFMIIFKCSTGKLLTLLGLCILFWVEHHAIFRRMPTVILLQNTPFWHSLGVIGAVLYILANECGACKKPAPKE